MTVKFLNRGFFQRIFGLPATSKPLDPQCWTFSDGKIMIDLKRATEIKKPGGALRLEGGGLPTRVLVIRGDDGNFMPFAIDAHTSAIAGLILFSAQVRSNVAASASPPTPTMARRSTDRQQGLSRLSGSKSKVNG